MPPHLSPGGVRHLWKRAAAAALPSPPHVSSPFQTCAPPAQLGKKLSSGRSHSRHQAVHAHGSRNIGSSLAAERSSHRRGRNGTCHHPRVPLLPLPASCRARRSSSSLRTRAGSAKRKPRRGTALRAVLGVFSAASPRQASRNCHPPGSNHRPAPAAAAGFPASSDGKQPRPSGGPPARRGAGPLCQRRSSGKPKHGVGMVRPSADDAAHQAVHSPQIARVRLGGGSRKLAVQPRVPHGHHP